MPLLHSSSPSAFKQNVKTLMGEVGSSPHVKSRSQALAVAYATKRRGRAMGGSSPPWFVKNEARSLMHTGPIMSAVPGRTDKHSMSVPSGAYVVPAQAVSHLGQSNTLAGMQVLGKMFNSGPYGASPMKMGHGSGAPKPPRAMSDDGGARGDALGQPTPIMAAGGEFVIPPEEVMKVGGGDLKRGHKILDRWIMQIKDEHARTIKKLPGPAKA